MLLTLDFQIYCKSLKCYKICIFEVNNEFIVFNVKNDLIISDPKNACSTTFLILKWNGQIFDQCV